MDDKRPNHALGYTLEILDDEIILFNQASEQVIHSNQTGALIWQLCDGQRTVTEITELLSAAYPDAAEDVQRDVQEVLHLLSTHGAITWK